MRTPDYDWWIAHAHEDSAFLTLTQQSSSFEMRVMDRIVETHPGASAQRRQDLLNQAMWRAIWEQDRFGAMTSILEGIQPDPPAPSGELIIRPLVMDFRGPAPDDTVYPKPMQRLYLAPSLCSISDSVQRRVILERHRQLGARHYFIWARWSQTNADGSGRPHAAQGWAGPDNFDAFETDEEMREFGVMLDEIIDHGMTPVVWVHDRGYERHVAVSEMRDMVDDLLAAHGDKIGWLCPEPESDEIREPDERGRMMRDLRARFDRVAIHFSGAPYSASDFEGLPHDCVIWGQVNRRRPTSELTDIARRSLDAAGGREIWAFEHSRHREGDSNPQNAAEQTRRLVALCRGGWRYSGNCLTTEGRIRSCVEWRPPAIDQLTDAMTDLVMAVPGTIRVSKDTVWHPGLAGGVGNPHSRRLDLLKNSTHPDPSQRGWQYVQTSWDGIVRPV